MGRSSVDDVWCGVVMVVLVLVVAVVVVVVVVVGVGGDRHTLQVRWGVTTCKYASLRVTRVTTRHYASLRVAALNNN